MSDKYDLSKITYEMWPRPGWAGTGATGPIESIEPGMRYFVGASYGPYETKAEAVTASERLLLQEAQAKDRERECRALADQAKAKLTEDEYDAISSLAVSEDRGYF